MSLLSGERFVLRRSAHVYFEMFYYVCDDEIGTQVVHVISLYFFDKNQQTCRRKINKRKFKRAEILVDSFIKFHIYFVVTIESLEDGRLGPGKEKSGLCLEGDVMR